MGEGGGRAGPEATPPETPATKAIERTPAFRVFFNEAAIREFEENCLAEEWIIESLLPGGSGKVLRVRFGGVIDVEDIKGSDFLSSGIRRVRAVAEVEAAEVLETHPL